MVIINRLKPPQINIGETKTFRLVGKSFFRVENVFLSGFPYEDTTVQAPFSGVPKLSAKYPSFTGIQLLSSSWVSNNSNTLTFTVPSAQRVGYVDVIVQNPAGYGSFLTYAIRNVHKFYLPEMPEYDSYTLYERPMLSGIRVKTPLQ
jgi:hypothetical protein